MLETIALLLEFSQFTDSLFSLFKVCRARVIKYKPDKEDLSTASAALGSRMFSKRTKRKIKQRLCTGYLEFSSSRLYSQLKCRNAQ